MGIVKERNIFIGIVALFAVIAFGLSWYIAALSDPAWVFGTNYLSDLGVSDVERSAMFFNAGCLIGGLLFVIFGVGLMVSGKKQGLAGFLAVIAGIAMAAIGIVTEDAGDPHRYLAYVAFGVGSLALAVLAVRDWKNGLKLLASFTPVGIALTILSYVLLCTDLIVTDLQTKVFIDIPGVETVAALVLFTLLTLQGMKYLYNGSFEKMSPDGKGISDRHRLAYGFSLLIGATAFLIFWLFAMLSAGSEWAFLDNPLYELGLIAGETQMFFTIACIGGGLFVALAGIGIGMMHGRYSRALGGFFITLTGISFILEGIAFITAGEMFEFVEYIMVFFGASGLLCITIGDWLNKRMVTAAFYLVLVLCGVASLLFFGYTVASALAILAFFVVLEIEGMRLTVG